MTLNTSLRFSSYLDSQALTGGGTSATCSDNVTSTSVQSSGSVTTATGQFGQLVFVNPLKAALKVFQFDKEDLGPFTSYLCEKITDYTCPRGSFLFDGFCYTLFSNPVTHAQADRNCGLTGGQLLAVKTRKQMTFLNAAFPSGTYSMAWLDYRRNTYSTTDSPFRAIDDSTFVFDSSGIDFTAGSPLGTTENCVVMSETQGAFNGWTTISCLQNASYICQKPQQLAPALIRILPVHQLLLPLDLHSAFRDLVMPARANHGYMVAISADQYLPSQLVGAAHFLGISNSYMQIDNTAPTKSFNAQFGISISMWIYIDMIYDGEHQFLIDARPECVTGSENDDGFSLFLYNGKGATAGLNTANPPSLCSQVVTFASTAATKNEVHLVAKLCTYNTSSVCQGFASPDAYPVPVNRWTHVGFTYNAVSQKGTFFIDNNYGYFNSATNSDSLSTYFTYDTGSWLTNSSSAAVSSPIRLGSRKYQQQGSFAGKMSCLQWYEGPLTQAQFLYLSSCPVNSTYAGKAVLCPAGYHYYKKNCYKFSVQAEDFSTAEAFCTSTPGS